MKMTVMMKIVLSPDHVETAVDGTLWLGFHSDICQFDAATMSCPQLFDLEDDLGLADGASIAHLEATADGGLLMHTFDEGSAYYDGSAWTTFVLADQTPSNYFSKTPATGNKYHNIQ